MRAASSVVAMHAARLSYVSLTVAPHRSLAGDESRDVAHERAWRQDHENRQHLDRAYVDGDEADDSDARAQIAMPHAREQRQGEDRERREDHVGRPERFGCDAEGERKRISLSLVAGERDGGRAAHLAAMLQEREKRSLTNS